MPLGLPKLLPASGGPFSFTAKQNSTGWMDHSLSKLSVVVNFVSTWLGHSAIDIWSNIILDHLCEGVLG